MLAPCATLVVLALVTVPGVSFFDGSAPPPRSPPSRIVPPALAPLALMVALLPTATLGALAMMLPPLPVVPRAVTFPVIVAVCPALIATEPPLAPSAETLPATETVPSACNSTRPPWVVVPVAWT